MPSRSFSPDPDAVPAPVAVVSMAGVFPGAPDIPSFVRMLRQGQCAAAEAPPRRWIAPAADMISPRQGRSLPDKSVTSRCCLVGEEFQFDPDGFSLPADLLAALDPLYHLTLHCGRKALSACRTDAVSFERIGVSLAAIALPTDASSRLTRRVFAEEQAARFFRWNGKTGLSVAKESFPAWGKTEALASRVTGLPASLLARCLRLGGECLTLDAACASSIYALKLACDALREGRADMMLTGGVSRPECLYTQVGFTQLTALSPTGRCAPFDASANGLVVGEGAGILALKRLDDALAAGDTIHAVIRGIGLSNDMRGNLLAPDTEGQLRAMRSAYGQARWTPDMVDHVECHGAGTPVGDNVEAASLRELWKGIDAPPGVCPIGSVKSNIGHLLTAAGAAGMIKTITGLKDGILAPSLHFERFDDKSPLAGGPFRVQTETEEWRRRNRDTPRRAAVSAFGFGGINAHILLEEFRAEVPQDRGSPPAPSEVKISAGVRIQQPRPLDIAIIGMEIRVGDQTHLRAFQEAVFRGRKISIPRPAGRFRGADAAVASFVKAAGHPADAGLFAEGAWISELELEAGRFSIPPKEIPDILPQQLLMLHVAAGAMVHAGLPLREMRPRMGAAIGMNFDMEACNFHLRWQAGEQLRRIYNRMGGGKTPSEAEIKACKDGICPPLTRARVLGSLGGIVASRVAREFRLGGPSHVLSCEDASGLRALEIGARSLRRGETDLFLAGAVDLAGDPRHVLAMHELEAYGTGIPPGDRAGNQGGGGSPENILAALAPGYDGPSPADAAAALVLKRREDAEKDGDRILALVQGISATAGGGVDIPADAAAARRSLEQARAEAGISLSSVDHVEITGTGTPEQTDIACAAAANALREANADRIPSLGVLSDHAGRPGAVAGLAAAVKTVLSLYQEIIPPLAPLEFPRASAGIREALHLPQAAQYRVRDRIDGPRAAIVSALSWDGTAVHLILEDPPAPVFRSAASVNSSGHSGSGENGGASAPSVIARRERRRPLGYENIGLFVVSGNTENEILAGLDELERHVHSLDGIALKGIERQAAAWFQSRPVRAEHPMALSIVARDLPQLKEWIRQARQAVRDGRPRRISGPSGMAWFPNPLGRGRGRIAFVYPGSGNHYLGMGRIIGVTWPRILRRMDAETGRLRAQMLPELYMPRRADWPSAWEDEAVRRISGDPLHMIFGQVVHGGVMTSVLMDFGIRPDAVIGYSLGESAGLFATRAWPEPGEMLSRMRETDLFHTRLHGPCTSLREAWKIPADQPADWKAAVVNRPADEVRSVMENHPHARLLIVNTPDQCVIGGTSPAVARIIRELRCESVYLDGVVSVHCDAALPSAEAYRRLHLFPCDPPPDIRYYSVARGDVHELTTESAAASILAQATDGFVFPDTVNKAWEDGIRIFVETGPGRSCSRMISHILGNRTHHALSADARGEDDFLTMLKCLGSLTAEGVPVNLERLYGKEYLPPDPPESPPESRRVIIPVGGVPVDGPPPEFPINHPQTEFIPMPIPEEIRPITGEMAEFIRRMAETGVLTAQAHAEYLRLSARIQQQMEDAILLLSQPPDRRAPPLPLEPAAPAPSAPAAPQPLFDREMCMEFAVGSVARMLGPEFAEVDAYPVRVRLPGEPLMLVDRIMALEGEKCALTPGRVVTEHDVLPGAWYLDGGRAPVCISVEAGQADLFLSGYLGIDLAVKGARAYRLLDARVRFHRGLPVPGETIQYDIHIDKFVRQAEVYLFFFRFEGTINGEPLITMRDGCAGFFTPEEVENSGGIILSRAERQPAEGISGFTELVPVGREAYDDERLEALRRGDAAGCFGPVFSGVSVSPSQILPSGRMRLVDRAPLLDPTGGRYGLGVIRAEADIHPDDWFLTCHFVDDMVMPGTLMYECCAHTLRILLQRFGWVTDRPDHVWEPVIGREAVLKCRGPVTPETRKVLYEVEIAEIGYGPEPYAVADAMMYGDGRPIVRFTGMSMKLTGAGREELESFWSRREETALGIAAVPAIRESRPALYDRRQLLAFCEGNPSEAFGPAYEIFDPGKGRKIARLPRPPYFFMNRVVHAEPRPWELKAGGWITAEYDMGDAEWYFRADRSGVMPFCVLLEIALQPCGWLAAYAGSALRSGNDLKFRNLGGKAVLYRNLRPGDGRLIMKARMTRVSEAGGMIVENFDMRVFCGDELIYDGDTYFGFFSREALANQVGIHGAAGEAWEPPAADLASARTAEFFPEAPLNPEDLSVDPAPSLAMPGKALRMIDRISVFLPHGGPFGLGFVRGEKEVDPAEWFFQAHFFEDPVCPGSLGLESFIQLMKFAALERWPRLVRTHCFEMLTGARHEWIYRGQVIPANRRVTVDAVITDIRDGSEPVIQADGWLKVDGLFIYRMKNFALRLAATASYKESFP